MRMGVLATLRNVLLALRVQLDPSTYSCFWVGWFRREERLDWNSETGYTGPARGPLFKCAAERRAGGPSVSVVR